MHRLATFALLLGIGLMTFVGLRFGQRNAAKPDFTFVQRSYLPPKGYVCSRGASPITIDGKLDEAAWATAPWTEDFVDIEGDKKPRPRFRTRAKMLWDDEYFYVAADLTEPHVWGTLTQRDSVIFNDNDFEVFIDPNGDNHEYYEFEINPLNTGWDLLLTRPYKDGGKALDAWDVAGLKTAIHVRGTLNDPRNEDEGWSLELAFPWKVLEEAANRPGPPKEGDQWRVNFSRVEWRHEVKEGKYVKVPKTPEDNWVWSPQGVIDMHRPEHWGYVQFTARPPGQAHFQLDPFGEAKHQLHQAYYAQREYRRRFGNYAASLRELGLHGTEWRDFRLRKGDRGYELSVERPSPDGRVPARISIREDALLRVE